MVSFFSHFEVYDFIILINSIFLYIIKQLISELK